MTFDQALQIVKDYFNNEDTATDGVVAGQIVTAFKVIANTSGVPLEWAEDQTFNGKETPEAIYQAYSDYMQSENTPLDWGNEDDFEAEEYDDEDDDDEDDDEEEEDTLFEDDDLEPV